MKKNSFPYRLNTDSGDLLTINPSLMTHFTQWSRSFLCILSICGLAHSEINAQVGLTATGGTATGSYATLSAAFAAINAGTHQGAIAITITGTTTEPTAVSSASASLSAGNAGLTAVYTSVRITPIGAATVTGVAAGYSLIDLFGADNVTIDGLNTGGNSLTISNTSTSASSGTSTIRFAVDATNNLIQKCTILGSSTTPLATNGGTIYFATAITTGNDNNTISNCDIAAAGTNLPSKAIYGNGTTTSATHANSGISITGCNIYDYFLAGGCAGVYASAGNTEWSMTNNKVYQTAARAMTSIMYGFYFSNSTYGSGITITGNTLGYASSTGTGSLTLSGGGAGSFYGVYLLALSTAALACNLNNNVISDLSIGTTGSIYGIYNLTGASSNTININGNAIRNITTTAASTGTMYAISWGSATTLSVSNNTITNINRGAASATYGLFSGSSSTNESINNNIISNITNSVAIGTVSFYAIYQNTLGGVKDIKNNSVFNISTASTGTVTFYGIRVGYGNAINISDNVVYGFSGTATTIYGIYGSGATAGGIYNIHKNKLYDLSSTSTSATIYGIYTISQTYNVYNNIIGDLRTPAANVAIAIAGIYASGGTNNNLYNNTVYLNATSTGAAFGTTALYAAATSPLRLNNNLLVNNSTPVGATGFTTAFRRAGAYTSSVYDPLSNNNAFYAGVPSATNLIFYDGTVSNPTLASYKALVTPFDASSVTTNPAWVSTNSSSANYLHIPSGPALNILESNGVNIPLFNTDFDGDNRPGPLASVNGGGTSYDIGADEFDGAPAVPRVNAVAIDIPTTQCVARARSITATVTPINPLTAVTLYYTINGANPRAVVMTGGDPGVASNWMGTIPAASPTNGVVAWYVEATDGIYSGSKLGTVYNDDPLAGVVVTAAATPTTVCATTATSITANFRPTTAIGAGAVASSTTGITPFAGGWGGTKTQYLIRASELFASGFLPVSNTITSLTINCTAVSGQAYPNFAIAMANTNAASMTSTFISGSSDVYSNAGYTPTVGANTFTFTSPFTWDGVSNIVITFCWTKPTSTNELSSTVKSDVTTFASALPHQADLATPAVLCGTTVSTRATVSSRPQFTFNNTPVLNYVWTDGGGANVGNTKTITPIVNANTTYNVRITNPQGCLLTGSAAVATVPFPSTPTATPTTQCGTRVPTCRATSTTSAATPIFRWYLVSADGTPLAGENGATLTNYSIARTTTFFVAEYNGVCESNRVPITVTVTTPELLTVSSNTTGCNNEAVGLQVTSPMGNFNTYVWSPAAGLFTDAAGTVAYVAGSSAAQVYAKSSTAGATTYTCNSANALCTNSQTAIVSVLPTSIVANVAGVAQFCTSGSAVLSVPAAPAGGILQWQESPDNNAWIDAPGANAATYNAPSITQTRYYRLAVRKTGGSNCIFSNTLTISVTSPTVGAPVNATKCGPGAVTLGVTGNFGLINWFAAPTGGTSLGAGTSYTPTVNTVGTTPFYAESSIIAGTYEAMGKDTSSVPAGTGASSERGIVFRADKSFLLVSAQYYSPTLNVTNTVTVRLLNDADGAILNTVTLPIVQGANPGWYTMNMNFDITAGRTYRLMAGFTSSVNRITTGADYTTAAYNNLSSLGTITGGYDFGASTTTYNYFHNISAIEICKSARVAVNAVVTTPPALTLSSVAPATCAGTPTTAVTVTSALGDYSNYTWSPATGVTGTTSAVFNPARTTTYTLSAAQATGDFCQNNASVTVTVNPLPTTPIISPATATLCTGGSAVQLAALTTSVPQKIGTPGASNGTTSYPAPYNNYFGGAKHQLLFTAAELRAAGLLTGSPIKSIKFTVTGVGTTFTGSLQDFHLKVGHTTLTALTTAFETGLTQVVAPSVVPITVGDIEHNFSTPFVWDGTSNLILETSYSNANTGTSTDNVQTEMTNSLAFDACNYYRTDGVSSSAIATATVATTSTSRPNVTFTTLVGCNWQALTTGLFTDAAATTPYVSGTAAAVYAKPAATTTYTATAVSLAGCTSTATRTVTVASLPIPAIANNRPLTFCPGDSTVLTASGGATYMWSTGEATASITAKTAGVYKVKVANAAGCMDSTMVTVALNARPTVAIANNRPTTFCVGDSTVLTASGGATYAWSTGAASAGITARTAGTYKVTVTNAGGCVDSSMVAITTNARPTAAVAGATAICAGDSTVLTASGGATYAWSTAATSASVNVKTAGTYKVTVTNAAGCVDSTSRMITVNARPSAGLSVTGVSTFCQGDSAILRARNGVTYRWTTPAGVKTDSVVVAKTSGNYKVVVANAAGCTDSVDITITVNPKPIASFTATSLGGNATFTNTSTNGNTYSWNFGDTTNLGTTANTTHAYRYNGTYTVKLVVTSAGNCRDSVTNTITITKVGNNELLKNLNALVYPNPTSDNLFIEFRDLTLNFHTGDYISVTDAFGREIHRQAINGHRVEVITENWAAGLYMIHVIVGNQKAGLGKIVKMSK